MYITMLKFQLYVSSCITKQFQKKIMLIFNRLQNVHCSIVFNSLSSKVWKQWLQLVVFAYIYFFAYLRNIYEWKEKKL